MTVEEAIKIIRGAWSLMCQTNIRFDFITDYREAAEIAVKALNEVQKYREIGTVEECRKAKRFKEYFDELYGIGLEVANWHQNGDTEPFDNFYDAAIDWSEQNAKWNGRVSDNDNLEGMEDERD